MRVAFFLFFVSGQLLPMGPHVFAETLQGYTKEVPQNQIGRQSQIESREGTQKRQESQLHDCRVTAIPMPRYSEI